MTSEHKYFDPQVKETEYLHFNAGADDIVDSDYCNILSDYQSCFNGVDACSPASLTDIDLETMMAVSAEKARVQLENDNDSSSPSEESNDCCIIFFANESDANVTLAEHKPSEKIIELPEQIQENLEENVEYCFRGDNDMSTLLRENDHSSESCIVISDNKSIDTVVLSSSECEQSEMIQANISYHSDCDIDMITSLPVNDQSGKSCTVISGNESIDKDFDSKPLEMIQANISYRSDCDIDMIISLPENDQSSKSCIVISGKSQDFDSKPLEMIQANLSYRSDCDIDMITSLPENDQSSKCCIIISSNESIDKDSESKPLDLVQANLSYRSDCDVDMIPLLAKNDQSIESCIGFGANGSVDIVDIMSQRTTASEPKPTETSIGHSLESVSGDSPANADVCDDGDVFMITSLPDKDQSSDQNQFLRESCIVIGGNESVDTVALTSSERKSSEMIEANVSYRGYGDIVMLTSLPENIQSSVSCIDANKSTDTVALSGTEHNPSEMIPIDIQANVSYRRDSDIVVTPSFSERNESNDLSIIQDANILETHDDSLSMTSAQIDVSSEDSQIQSLSTRTTDCSVLVDINDISAKMSPQKESGSSSLMITSPEVECIDEVSSRTLAIAELQALMNQPENEPDLLCENVNASSNPLIKTLMHQPENKPVLFYETLNASSNPLLETVMHQPENKPVLFYETLNASSNPLLETLMNQPKNEPVLLGEPVNNSSDPLLENDNSEGRKMIIESLKSLINAGANINVQSALNPGSEVTMMSVDRFTFTSKDLVNSDKCLAMTVDDVSSNNDQETTLNILSTNNVEMKTKVPDIFPQCHEDYKKITLDLNSSLQVASSSMSEDQEMINNALNDTFMMNVKEKMGECDVLFIDDVAFTKQTENKITPEQVNTLFRNGCTHGNGGDENEEADNNSPGWEPVRRLKTPQAKFNYVRQQWTNSMVPNPHRNLSSVRARSSENHPRPRGLPRFSDGIYMPVSVDIPCTVTRIEEDVVYNSEHPPYDYSNDISLEDLELLAGCSQNDQRRGVKRPLESGAFQQAAKRARRVPFTVIYHNIIDAVRGSLREKMDALVQEERDSYEQLTSVQRREYCTFRRRNSSLPRHERKMHMHHYQTKRNALTRELDAQNLKITEAVNQMTSLQELYNGANDDGGDTYFMGESEVEEVIESLAYYRIFDHCYK